MPLTPSPDGPYLEAAIDAVPLPANLIVQASFTAGSKDQRFDFTFTEHSVAAAPTTIDGATRLAMDIPDDTDGVLAMLRERRDSVKEIVARGSLTEVWVPALQAKDLALTLEMHAREFPDRAARTRWAPPSATSWWRPSGSTPPATAANAKKWPAPPTCC